MPLKEKPSPVYRAHLDAIQSGEVTRRNVTGIRKLLNGMLRKSNHSRASACSTVPFGVVAPMDSPASLRNIPWQSGGDGPEVVA